MYKMGKLSVLAWAMEKGDEAAPTTRRHEMGIWIAEGLRRFKMKLDISA